jgi:hypothetical protein
LGIDNNRYAGIGIQVPLRMEWFNYCASSSLVIYITLKIFLCCGLMGKS